MARPSPKSVTAGDRESSSFLVCAETSATRPLPSLHDQHPMPLSLGMLLAVGRLLSRREVREAGQAGGAGTDAEDAVNVSVS